MITKSEIDSVLKSYDPTKITIATICSHSALQIFHGARREGFRTLGITGASRVDAYESFPLAAPDEFLVVDDFKDILDEEVQEKLIRQNTIIIPHGSFVEYVGPRHITDSLRVPMFGNRRVLEWEGERDSQREWLKKAGLRIPRQFKPSEIDGPCIVKFSGAKGGMGFFFVHSQDEYQDKLDAVIKSGKISENEKPIIMEYVVGVRYYPHFFFSPVMQRLELLSIDQRMESNIDELHRMGLTNKQLSEFGIERSFVVTGNLPITIRESLLPKMVEMGKQIADTSEKLFPPGMVGPFCLETICTDELEIVTFEISARIVAGTNLFPLGSPYSCYTWDEEMSTGRRIARELLRGADCLERLCY